MNSSFTNVEGMYGKHIAAKKNKTKQRTEEKRQVCTTKFKVQVTEACDEVKMLKMLLQSIKNFTKRVENQRNMLYVIKNFGRNLERQEFMHLE